MSKLRLLAATALLAGLGVMVLAFLTAGAMRPLPQTLAQLTGQAQGLALLDRHGARIMREDGQWNQDDFVALSQVPEFLRQSFILAEDKRFYSHHGVDWLARLHAAWQCAVNLRPVRGASTITEQVVKMIHPRPRTAWTRWVEGFEAMELEENVAKEEILEFYINQVPYASNRRGVAQAARYYFDRELSSLSKKEMLALAVLPRRPTGYDLYRQPGRIESQIGVLAGTMERQGLISGRERGWIGKEPIRLKKPGKDTDTFHFVNYLLSMKGKGRLPAGQARTTLDLGLQQDVASLLDERMLALAQIKVVNAAALVADHTTGEILAWVVYGDREGGHPGSFIDAALAPRQPGSALKPFLYALALESGWTAATILKDEPLDTRIGAGLHSFRNYSRSFYGPITVRDALANSLNIPAVLTLRHTGRERYLDLLRSLGITSLGRPAEFYGDALALGAGEVSLYEMTQAYATLANRGVMRPLTALMEPDGARASRIFSGETTSIIASILSDPSARRLEFPMTGVLNFPQPTAVKTGTSTDFHDAWAFGFDHRFVAGVWMGALSGAPADGLTGASGPAMVLRGLFARLNRNQPSHPLYQSPALVKASICQDGENIYPADGACLSREELFAPGTEKILAPAPVASTTTARLTHPAPGLMLAMDPRVPLKDQAVEFKVDGLAPGDLVEWRLDGKLLAVTDKGRYIWPLRKGDHSLAAAVVGHGARMELAAAGVEFTVK